MPSRMSIRCNCSNIGALIANRNNEPIILFGRHGAAMLHRSGAVIA